VGSPSVLRSDLDRPDIPEEFKLIDWEGIVRANSFTLPKRQSRISRPLISCIFPARSERFDGRSKYLEFCSDNAQQNVTVHANPLSSGECRMMGR
jgi:hypothetical protein